MNKKQRAIVTTVAVLILASLIFPPESDSHGKYFEGYKFLLYSSNIYITLLLTQWLGLLIASGFLWFLVSDNNGEIEDKTSNNKIKNFFIACIALTGLFSLTQNQTDKLRLAQLASQEELETIVSDVSSIESDVSSLQSDVSSIELTVSNIEDNTSR